MSTLRLIWGVKIYTGTVITDASIGLYSGVLKWIENSFADIVGSWKTDMIYPESFSPVNEAADLRRSGGVAELRGSSFKTKNTALLFAALEGHGISLNGCKAEQIEFENIGGAVTETVLLWGKAKVTAWNETDYQVEIETAYDSMNANITKEVDAVAYPNSAESDRGKAIPASFGEIPKAKLVRTASSINTLSNGEIMSSAVPAGTMIFPITSDQTDPTLNYDIDIGTSAGAAILANLNGKFIQVVEGAGSGQIRRIDASTITGGSPTIAVTVASFFEDTLQGNATANKSVDGTLVQTWVKIVDAASDYEADTWNCKDFVDSDNLPVADGMEELYSHVEEKSVVVPDAADLTEAVRINVRDAVAGFVRLPEQAYKNSSTSANNKVQMQAEMFNGSFDEMDCFLILPVVNPVIGANGTNYGINPYASRGNGVYAQQAVTIDSYPSAADLNHIIGYNYAEFARWQVTNHIADAEDMSEMAVAIEFQLPPWPSFFKPDECYLMILADIDSDWYSLSADVYTRRFMGTPSHPIEVPRLLTVGSSLAITSYKALIDDSPDFFYQTSAPSTNNRNHYVERDAFVLMESTHYYTGFTKFLLQLSKEDAYNSVYKAALFLGALLRGPQDDKAIITINKVAAMFKKSVSIKEAIYSPLQGRTWRYPIGNDVTGNDDRGEVISVTQTAPPVSPTVGDVYWVPAGASGAWAGQDNKRTIYMPDLSWFFAAFPVGAYVTVAGTTNQYVWSGSKLELARKSGFDMIQTPIEIFEHVARLQNWNKAGDLTTVPGTAYSPNAAINTGTGIGGFENPALLPVTSCRPAFQLQEYDDCLTGAIKEQLCKTFWLVSYLDTLGRECLQFIAPYADDMVCSDSITDLDIPEGLSAGDVEEPKPEDIYCEPFVRYNYNWATNEPQSVISIKNTYLGSGNWQAAYTPGIGGAYAEAIWEICADLWNRCKQINKPPSDMTDQPMIKRYTDAVWFLRTWVRWQSMRRIPVPINYAKGRKLHVGGYVSLNLKSQTNSQTVKCVIEEITKDKSARNGAGLATVKLIMVSYDPASASSASSYSSASSDSASSDSSNSSGSSASASSSSTVV